MQLVSSVQIGKNGLTENTIETIKTHFKNHLNVKVVFLKSSSRDNAAIKKEAEKIVSKLGNNYTYRIIGFTVFIKKWRKPMR
ncbi:YhbY family RNA-binding protein [Candidatus Pacearchaeota archaeon]|nr:YhbY family RNA-binding protein [Candidatus Pacearchaeota archaeon]